MPSPLIKKISAKLGARVVASRALPGGDIADVSLLTLDNHTEIVAKRPRADQPDTTAVEAKMLKHLALKSALPVPKVLLQAKGLLVLSYIPHRGMTAPTAATENVASHIAALHSVRPKGNRPYYGHQINTYIGPLPQINTPSSNWCDFFTENRLLAMAHSCANTHKIDTALMQRIETLAGKLSNYLPSQPKSSLLHGDLWRGNMLIDGDKAAAFIDPAISYGHAEMDLAFAEMMGGLASNFLDTYKDLYPLDAGYEQDRRAVYQLWPLLVHARLFGGGYVQQVDDIVRRFGC